MNRRHFLARSAVAGFGIAAARWPSSASTLFADEPEWRTFEVVTRVHVLEPKGETHVWLPEVMRQSMPFQRTLSTVVDAPGGHVSRPERAADSLALVSVLFPAGVAPAITVTSRVSTRDYAVDLTRRTETPTPASLDYFRRPTKLIPTSGIVKSKALEITKDAKTDVEKARAIYAWVVDETHRDAAVQGCGTGDIRYMLESGNLGGKCADINALYVGLARACGLPARDVYGLRVAPSRKGLKSLGTSSEDVTKAQHCRAEVYLTGYGWVPVDPADVRKVMLEEPPGHRPADDDVVKQERTRLFGSWEMNWVAYNYAHDVELTGSSGRAIPFLMYPQAETTDGRVNSLDAAGFQYAISAREVS
jgi:transglutaminase-like putative cysteine protease